MRIARVEVAHELRLADSSCADLSDSNARSVVGEDRGLLHGPAARVRKRERGDHRVARSGDVKYFPRECWKMLRRSGSVEEGHAFFTARNQGVVAVEFLKQSPAGGLKRFRAVDRHSGEQFRFAVIRSNHRDRPVVVGMMDFRIEEYRNASL